MTSTRNRHVDPRAQLDALIDFYESQRPDAGGRIPVVITPAKLGKVLGRSPCPGSPAEFNYRGRIIVATAAP